MSSLSFTPGQWQKIENQLRAPLDEIEELCRNRPGLEARFETLRMRLPGSPLAGLVARTDHTEVPAASPAEALAFQRRHSHEDSVDRRYSACVDWIRGHHDSIALTNELLRNLHARITPENAPDKGRWKTANNHFPVQASDGTLVSSLLTVHFRLVDERMTDLEQRMTDLWSAGRVNRHVLTAAYWLDLMCIHPFRDGNGRTCRLVALLLLLQSGLDIWKTASLEGIMGKRRGAYITALRTQLNGWWTGDHDLHHWCRFIFDLTCGATRDLEKRVNRIESRLDEADRIGAVVRSLPAPSSVRDVQRQIPDVNPEIVALVLHTMKAGSRSVVE